MAVNDKNKFVLEREQTLKMLMDTEKQYVIEAERAAKEYANQEKKLDEDLETLTDNRDKMFRIVGNQI